jgi:hypothetical protein
LLHRGKELGQTRRNPVENGIGVEAVVGWLEVALQHGRRSGFTASGEHRQSCAIVV